MTIVPQLSPPTAFMTFTEMTPLNTSTAPTDRSMPAVMITYVMPVAMTSRTAASVAMLRALEAETKLSYSSTEKARIRPARIRPIHDRGPLANRRHQTARSGGGRVGGDGIVALDAGLGHAGSS